MKLGGLDSWRNYFRTANSGIFDIIENAITVAASDCPMEFTLRRDRIAEILFTCKLARCSGCDGVGFEVPEKEEDEGCKSGSERDACELEAVGGGSKGSGVDSTRDEHTGMNINQISNYSYGEAEALTDEIEEESQIVGEVLRIRQLLQNSEDQSESALVDSLRRLQLMELTVDILKATEIGKTVNAIRKHGSKDIRHLARMLIGEWKNTVDDWVNATASAKEAAAAAITEGTPDSVNLSVLDEEEGLPSPPLDEGIFFATQPTSMELSKFFDGMDDDGNTRNCGEFIKNHDNGRKPSMEKPTVPRQRPNYPEEANLLTKDNKGQSLKQEVVVKTNKPLNAGPAPGKPQKMSVEKRDICEVNHQQKLGKATLPKRAPQDNKCTDEGAAQIKLEATKRKLHESYQQAENAKKQRTIQVMELHDLPKQGIAHRNPQMKPGNLGHGRNPHMKPGIRNRPWTNGRR